jgi:amino acid transporter
MTQSVEDSTARPKLRRELGLLAVVGISLATMAPSMAVNINPQGMVPEVGPAVPLAFMFATIGILLVAYSFMRLSQRFDHAGSLYGMVGATLGPRAGVIAGWLLVGTYAAFGVVTSIAAGRFAASLASSLGFYTDPSETFIYMVSIALVVGATAIALGKPSRSTGVLVVVEAATCALILLVSVVILHRLSTGDTPTGMTIDWSVLAWPSGVTGTAMFLGVTFGFLSFAGFEAAATLGEEARSPRRTIPRALMVVPAIAGVFFVFVTAVEVMGFGTSETGLTNFENSESLMGDLASVYLSSWVGDLITIGALFSAISCTLAVLVATSRLLFAYGRDGLIPGGFGELTDDDAIPARAVLATSTVIIVVELVAWILLRADSLTVFIQAGETGVLLILVAYLLATLGMGRRVFIQGDRSVPRWQVVIPTVAVLLLAATLLSNVIPLPTGVDLWSPCLAGLWIVGALVVALRMKCVPATIAESIETESVSGS